MVYAIHAAYAPSASGIIRLAGNSNINIQINIKSIKWPAEVLPLKS